MGAAGRDEDEWRTERGGGEWGWGKGGGVGESRQRDVRATSDGPCMQIAIMDGSDGGDGRAAERC